MAENNASPREMESQVRWDDGSGTATLAIPKLRELLKDNEALRQSNEALARSNEALRLRNEDYEAVYGDLPSGGRRDYKDQLFRFIFSRPEWTLDLYNALRRTDHKDPGDVEFTTIGGYLYLGMRNDVSFTIGSEMMLWEHQSTYNANMPARIVPYVGAIFNKLIGGSGHSYYGTELRPVPVPLSYCFYNGTADRPDTEVLRLSDAYNMYINQLADDGLEWDPLGKELLEGMVASIEVAVIMVNVNHGRNRGLLDACRPLEEYSWLVAEVRRNQERYNDLALAIDEALDAMPGDFVTRDFLMDHRREVFDMLYEDFDAQVVWRGGYEGGVKETRIEIVTNLIRRGRDSAEEISDATGVPVDEVERLAEELGATLPRQ